MNIPAYLVAKVGDEKRKTIGEPDFCGLGCLIVHNIRVPFPDCTVHGANYELHQAS